MTFRLANINGRSSLVDANDYYDIAEISGGVLSSDPMDAILDLATLHDLGARLSDFEPRDSLSGTTLGPPIPRPRNVFAVGLNDQGHIAEAAMEAPDVPLVFAKFSSCIVGPDADIELRCETGDYEAEMVAVIGTAGRDIPETEAWNHVAGVMVGQDISDRALQFAAKPPHFDLGKSRDTYGPTGPFLVSTDLLADRDAMPITCDVNGERRQDGSTGNLIFGVAELVAYLSTVVSLAPGDLIFTGTPQGVGAAQGKFLAPGDVVTTRIDGLGVLTNRCK